MAQQYNDPYNGSPSTVGPQFNVFHWRRQAIIEAQDMIHFGNLSKSEMMPKNYGKTIKVYNWIPLLDDRNVNDQGIDASGTAMVNGNIYGSSKDINAITDSLPAIGENGGRVNRVGFTRLELEAEIHELGFFFEYTQDSLDFDTETELLSHLEREATRGAIAISEAVLGIDLINGAGVIGYSGIALDDDEMTGNFMEVPSIVSYKNLSDLSITLDKNKTPKSTKIITGSTKIDTKVIPACRFMFIGTELQTTLEKMRDNFGNAAFIPVEHYASSTTVHPSEIGKVGKFRIVVNLEMPQWSGAGATDTTGGESGYYTDGAKFNIYPMLVVGSESFVTIGYHSSGMASKTEPNSKFKTLHAKPGEYLNPAEPFGKKGFKSISWWYGTLILRPEMIAVQKTLAEI
jgi:N4-gp56 family major capsid protein